MTEQPGLARMLGRHAHARRINSCTCTLVHMRMHTSYAPHAHAHTHTLILYSPLSPFLLAKPKLLPYDLLTRVHNACLMAHMFLCLTLTCFPTRLHAVPHAHTAPIAQFLGCCVQQAWLRQCLAKLCCCTCRYPFRCCQVFALCPCRTAAWMCARALRAASPLVAPPSQSPHSPTSSRSSLDM